MKLQNKIAVITGSNSGIGFAIANEFKKEGAKVASIAKAIPFENTTEQDFNEIININLSYVKIAFRKMVEYYCHQLNFILAKC
jgi:NAD(P)-dependent dehydrogenase (short-subunit alcohol dehydrogenase family)